MASLVLSATETHRFIVGDTLADIPAVIAAVDACADRYAVPDDQRYAIQVCLEEVLANIILHGKIVEGTSKSIEVCFKVCDGEAQICVCDTCVPFDTSQPPPAIADPLRVGGRGLNLLHAFSRKLVYRRSGNRNCLDIFV